MTGVYGGTGQTYGGAGWYGADEEQQPVTQTIPDPPDCAVWWIDEDEGVPLTDPT